MTDDCPEPALPEWCEAANAAHHYRWNGRESRCIGCGDRIEKPGGGDHPANTNAAT